MKARVLRFLALGVVLVLLGFVAGLFTPAYFKLKGPTAGWKQQYAYTLGTQAVIYGFPWVLNSTLRYKWVTQKPDNEATPYSALNHFWHASALLTSDYQDDGAPNNDTMYSFAWLDLRNGPIILSVPDIPGNRYYSFELASFETDNFAYVGTRTNGQKGGHYAIIGPGWHGSLPPGVIALPPSSTPYAMILGRTLVDGPADVPNAQRLMKQYVLTPLSYWGKPESTFPAVRDVWDPGDWKKQPMNFWRTLNRAMTENPPRDPQEARLVKMFSTIGVGPNQDVDTVDTQTRAGLTRAVINGLTLLDKMIKEGQGKRVNGWIYPVSNIGRAGGGGDYLTRSGFQSMAGIVANDAVEGVYLNTGQDVDGKPLDGGRRYMMHFGPSEYPPVKAFWSVTMYQDGNLVANPINRYSIGDRTAGLKKEPDGGLAIYIQNTSPGPGKESNWLPAPKGRFFLIMRTYIPEAPLVNQTWVPPAVTLVK